MAHRYKTFFAIYLALTIVGASSLCPAQDDPIMNTGPEADPATGSETERQPGASVEGPVAVAARKSAGKTPPNFVFILADDMGWTGLSCQMDDRVPASKSDFYQTPRIDQLARQGIRFSNAYSPGSMCTPSRASLLTGKSPAALRMTTPGPSYRQVTDRKLIPPRHIDSLPEEEITIAEILRRRKYATAHFGKWHLAGGGPGRHGFDRHDGATENGGAGLYDDPNPKDVFGITDRAVTFMKDQVAAGRPFYVQLSHYAVHAPHLALDSTRAAFAERPSGTRHGDVQYAAMTADLDTSVGMVLDSIDRLGIADTTYVVFMSDNGAAAPPRSSENQPLSGGKATLWEGGIRVPLIVRGPGIQANRFCHENVVGYDLFSTFCELADVPPASDSSAEGTSLVPLLQATPDGVRFQREPKELVFHFPHYARGPNQTPQSAILSANFKLIRFLETNENALFDLDRDISERNDLATKMPDKASALAARLDAYLIRVDAQLPSLNPDYAPPRGFRRPVPRRGIGPRWGRPAPGR